MKVKNTPEGTHISLVIDNRDLPVGSVDLYQTFTGEANDEYMEQMEREHLKEAGLDPDDYEITIESDMPEIHQQHAQLSVEILRDLLAEHEEDEVVINISDPLRIASPKFYNYTTDSYTAEWTICREALMGYINSKPAEYKKYLRGTGEYANSWEFLLKMKEDSLKEHRLRLSVAEKDGKDEVSERIRAYERKRISEAEEDLNETRWITMLGFYIKNTIDPETYTMEMFEQSENIYYEHSEPKVERRA